MVAEAGSASSARSRARTGSSDTSAAAGSPITATSNMPATLGPKIIIVKTISFVGCPPPSGWPGDGRGCYTRTHVRRQGAAMFSDADHEVIDSPEALFRHLYEEHGVEEARELDPDTAPLPFWLRRHADLERAERPARPPPQPPDPPR